MKRRIHICSGQFGDLSHEELCRMVSDIGYEGLEVAVQAHLDVDKAAQDDAYREAWQGVMDEYGLVAGDLSAHLMGQCVGDTNRADPRLDNFAPGRYAGDTAAIRDWAIDGMMTTAHAAKALGVDIVACFLGSPIWPYWYSFPQTPPALVDEGFAKTIELWEPIFDEYDKCGVKLALEVHPAEIAFDYYTTKRLLDEINWRPTLGLNYDPSHLLWQGVDPLVFLADFADRIYHVHLKDVKLSRDPRAGMLGSHIEFGDTRRGWNFVSLGHGDVDFDGIIRQLNQDGYTGPLCVEWEDSGMERQFGATEAFEFASKINYEPSEFGFDAALKTE